MQRERERSGFRMTGNDGDSTSRPSEQRLVSSPTVVAVEEDDPMMSLRSDVIEGYRLLKCIGRGGMGVVYKALQLSLEREVAVKLLDPVLTRDESFVKRFEQEAKALASLKHPNITSVIDRGVLFCDDGPLCYFVMEYIEGATLRELMDSRGALGLRFALRLYVQILEALEYTHRRGIIHRDLKPANIMVENGEHIKITDFGLAGILEKEAGTHLTRTNMVMGTVDYMAPEQRRDSSSVDQRADIYSLGVILYEMLTGRLPMGCFPRPSELRPEIPRFLDGIVMRCLAVDVDKRYQSVEELIADVKKVLEHLDGSRRPESGRTVTGIPASGTEAESGGRGRSLARAAGVLLVLVLVAMLGARYSGITPWRGEANEAAARRKVRDLVRRCLAGWVPDSPSLAEAVSALRAGGDAFSPLERAVIGVALVEHMLQKGGWGRVEGLEEPVSLALSLLLPFRRGPPDGLERTRLMASLGIALIRNAQGGGGSETELREGIRVLEELRRSSVHVPVQVLRELADAYARRGDNSAFLEVAWQLVGGGSARRREVEDLLERLAAVGDERVDLLPAILLEHYPPADWHASICMGAYDAMWRKLYPGGTSWADKAGGIQLQRGMKDNIRALSKLASRTSALGGSPLVRARCDYVRARCAEMLGERGAELFYSACMSAPATASAGAGTITSSAGADPASLERLRVRSAFFLGRYLFCRRRYVEAATAMERTEGSGIEPDGEIALFLFALEDGFLSAVPRSPFRRRLTAVEAVVYEAAAEYAPGWLDEDRRRRIGRLVAGLGKLEEECGGIGSGLAVVRARLIQTAGDAAKAASCLQQAWERLPGRTGRDARLLAVVWLDAAGSLLRPRWPSRAFLEGILCSVGCDKGKDAFEKVLDGIWASAEVPLLRPDRRRVGGFALRCCIAVDAHRKLEAGLEPIFASFLSQAASGATAFPWSLLLGALAGEGRKDESGPHGRRAGGGRSFVPLESFEELAGTLAEGGPRSMPPWLRPLLARLALEEGLVRIEVERDPARRRRVWSVCMRLLESLGASGQTGYGSLIARLCACADETELSSLPDEHLVVALSAGGVYSRASAPLLLEAVRRVLEEPAGHASLRRFLDESVSGRAAGGQAGVFPAVACAVELLRPEGPSRKRLMEAWRRLDDAGRGAGVPHWLRRRVTSALAGGASMDDGVFEALCAELSKRFDAALGSRLFRAASTPRRRGRLAQVLDRLLVAAAEGGLPDDDGRSGDLRSLLALRGDLLLRMYEQGEIGTARFLSGALSLSRRLDSCGDEERRSEWAARLLHVLDGASIVSSLERSGRENAAAAGTCHSLLEWIRCHAGARGDALALFLSAKVYEVEGFTRKALEVLDRALRLLRAQEREPGEEGKDRRLEAGIVYETALLQLEDLGDVDGALEFLRRNVEPRRLDSDAALCALMGRIHLDELPAAEKNAVAAAQWYARAAALDKSNPLYRFHWARAVLSRADPSRADVESAWRILSSLGRKVQWWMTPSGIPRPGAPDWVFETAGLRYWTGLAALLLGRREEGMKLLESSVEDGEMVGPACVGLYEAWCRRGRRREGLVWLERAFEERELPADRVEELMEAELMEGRPAWVLSHADAAPAGFGISLALTRAAVLCRRWEEALGYLTGLEKEMRPGAEGVVWRLKGIVAAELGRWEEAADCWRRAGDAGDPVGMYLYALLPWLFDTPPPSVVEPRLTMLERAWSLMCEQRWPAWCKPGLCILGVAASLRCGMRERARSWLRRLGTLSVDGELFSYLSSLVEGKDVAWPRDLRSRLLRRGAGWAALQAGGLGEALRCFDALVKEGDRHWSTLLGYAESLEGSGRTTAALRAYAAAYVAGEPSGRAEHKVAALLERLGLRDWAEAWAGAGSAAPVARGAEVRRKR